MKKNKILVIDNNIEYLHLMTDLLEGQGQSVVAVTDVLASLDVLVEYTPDIIKRCRGIHGGRNIHPQW